MNIYLKTDLGKLYHGDALDTLKQLPDNLVQCVITSPPYWQLRDYGVDGQIGLEATPQEYVGKLVTVFREVRRVLKDDGTVWLVLGDSYAGSWKGGHSEKFKSQYWQPNFNNSMKGLCPPGLKPKDLIGLPWMIAFALRDDKWYLRQDLIWHKPNPFPESVTDRCTKAHEYIFLLSKNKKYYYDAKAVNEPSTYGPGWGWKNAGHEIAVKTANVSNPAFRSIKLTRNKRSVWSIATQPFHNAHFATFPPKLIEPCILAGSNEGDIILDPFSGAGTTAVMADKHKRQWIGIELNEDYCVIQKKRIKRETRQLTII